MRACRDGGVIVEQGQGKERVRVLGPKGEGGYLASPHTHGRHSAMNLAPPPRTCATA